MSFDATIFSRASSCLAKRPSSCKILSINSFCSASLGLTVRVLKIISQIWSKGLCMSCYYPAGMIETLQRAWRARDAESTQSNGFFLTSSSSRFQIFVKSPAMSWLIHWRSSCSTVRLPMKLSTVSFKRTRSPSFYATCPLFPSSPSGAMAADIISSKSVDFWTEIRMLERVVRKASGPS